MLFNSYLFVLVFLPLTLLGCVALGRVRFAQGRLPFLLAASLLFYGYWNPPYLLLLCASILANWSISQRLAKSKGKGTLTAGVVGNLLLLGYYKYADFFIESSNGVFGSEIGLLRVILPLGISFFTFQQIAYLVDLFRGTSKPSGLMEYALFVSFFPQLIAGPIVHHKDLVPQFNGEGFGNINASSLARGLTYFTFGLVKKVLIADTFLAQVNKVYGALGAGHVVGFYDAWSGALSYTFQLYFDFSGYSDMAVGLGIMFGVALPLNFNSPYKATSIIDFWRRWHITLSVFLRDYLYIPLGGNRGGEVMRYRNLLLTMVLGGLWHGASWMMILWGAFHGVLLVANHLLNRFFTFPSNRVTNVLSMATTFLLVNIGWVLFRSASVTDALTLFGAMTSLVGDPITFSVWIKGHVGTFAMLFAGTIVTMGLPNTQQIMGLTEDVKSRFKWAPTLPWAIAQGIAMVVAILCLSRISEFLYFQF